MAMDGGGSGSHPASRSRARPRRPGVEAPAPARARADPRDGGSRPRTAWEAGRRPAAIPVAAVAVAGTGNGTPATVPNPSRPLSPPPPQEPPQPRCALNLLGGLMKEGGRNISYRLVYSRLDPSKSQLAAVAFRPTRRQTHDDSLDGNGSLFGWLVADDWCWFVLREEYCCLVAAGCWWLDRSISGRQGRPAATPRSRGL
jgi:hypothetical protein